MTNEEIFNYEQKRLKDVIKKLNEQIKNNEKKLSEQEHFIIGFKEGQRGTQFNRQALMSFYATEINELKRIIDNPYFGRFEFLSDKDKELQTIYIGKKSIMDEFNHAIAYDWRSEICSMYYDYNIGPAEYTVNNQKETGNITSKRQIIIKNGQLESVSEQDTISDDKILLKYLNESADSRLKSIIATIQREQNKIIRNSLKNSYIVNGVAGSGKTTVALHRIAYLLYNEARNINESNFLIIGPNKYFLNYISELLPELDIKNVSSLTFEEIVLNSLKLKVKLEPKNKILIDVLNNKYNENIISYKSQISYIKLLEEFVKTYILGNLDKDITYEGITLCTKEKLKYICNNNFSITSSSYAEKINNLIKTISKEIKEKSDDFNNDIWLKYRTEFLSLSKDNPRRKEIIEITNKINDEIKKGCPNILKEYFKFIKVNPLHLYQSFIENIDKLSSDNIIPELQKETLIKLNKKQIESSDLSPLLLISYLINGLKDYDHFEHIIIDEAQDLSIADYYILKKIFNKATFDIYGDINQSIYNYSGINDWNSINKQIFDNKAVMLELNKSYRTTKEISDTSNLVLNFLNTDASDCIARSGHEIYVNKLDNKNDLSSIIEQIYNLLSNNYETIAIICKDDIETNKVYKSLSKLGLQINIITDKNEEYTGGISVLPSYLSKGLEFDAVILYNANDINYPNSIIDQKLLYVSITRAMHELYINYYGNISNSLENLIKNNNNTKKLIRK